MGSGYGIRCKTCDYKFSVVLGHGMLECGFLENDYLSGKAMFLDRISCSEVNKQTRKYHVYEGFELSPTCTSPDVFI